MPIMIINEKDKGGPTTVRLDVSENGIYQEADKVYSPVVVDVPQTTIEGLSVTENATYTAPEGKAYSPVVVNVPLPPNAHLLKSATSYPIAPSLLPLPKAEVTFEGNKAELYVGSEPIVVAEDNTPYIYRQSPQNKSAVDVSLVGGTVAWNQLVQNGNFASVDRWSVSGGSQTVTNNILTATSSSVGMLLEGNVLGTQLNHKYLVSCFIKYDTAVPTGSGDIAVGSGGYSMYMYPKSRITLNNWTHIEGLFNRDSNSGNDSFRIYMRNGGANEVVEVRNCMTIDLTQAFGSTIADYIYTLEQSTAGSGIAWLRSYGSLTKDYYAYQSGKLESVNVASRKVYDSNNTLLATYLFDSSKILRGIPKLSNGQMYYDGDVMSSDGKIQRKFGVVDLGSLSWGYSAGAERFYAQLPTASTSTIQPCVCTKYLYNVNTYIDSDRTDKVICTISQYVYIRDSSNTDAQAFTTAMNGVYLVYELATPTTESATPFTNPQLVGSTEEFTDATSRDVMIPVGQDSNYANSDIYISYGTSPIDMAKEHSIVPYTSTYIDSNGSEDVEYWD